VGFRNHGDPAGGRVSESLAYLGTGARGARSGAGQDGKLEAGLQ
jgi:hypothetical protein